MLGSPERANSINDACMHLARLCAVRFQPIDEVAARGGLNVNGRSVLRPRNAPTGGRAYGMRGQTPIPFSAVPSRAPSRVSTMRVPRTVPLLCDQLRSNRLQGIRVVLVTASLRLHAQLLEVQVALDTAPYLVADLPPVPQVEHG